MINMNNVTSMTQNELFDRLTALRTEQLTLAEDIKAIKSDATLDPDMNPRGITKEDVKLIDAASRFAARQDFDDKKEAANAVFNMYESLMSMGGKERQEQGE